MRFRLLPVTSSGTSTDLAMLIAAAGRRGIVITDNSAYKGDTGNLAFRMAPSAARFLSGTPSWHVLNGFPWSKLKLRAVGSDSNPTPTA